MQDIVELRGITKYFGALLANASVDLTLRAGEIQALLGENGAGKSTLVKVLYGLLRPDSGEILIDGKSVVLGSPREARAQGIGMVFQHFSLFEEMTALENIAIPIDGAVADRVLAARVRQKADHFGLAINLDRPVHTLSAGERQRIEILRALMQEPRILILDEPTSVLTPDESEALFLTLDRLKAEGAGILFISHKLEEVRRLCSTATILRMGRVVGTADPKAVSARDLATLMVGEGVADLRPAAGGTHPGDAVLVCRDLAVEPESIHGVRLEGINLTVRAGEIVAIAGIAGNGQSELYAAISGEGGRITAGSVTIGAHDVTRVGITARRKAGAAFVPEARLGQATLPQGSLSDNIVLSWHATEDIGGIFLDRTNLEAISTGIVSAYDVRVPKADPAAAQLSGGNLQKYIVGREVTRNPGLIVVDQPCWGVDARAARHIRQTLIDLAAKGAAVLVITQDLDEALSLADGIVVMREGKLSEMLPTNRVTRASIGLLMTAGRAGNEKRSVA
jgi:general nucleoside transport system ATP-binding protein